MDKEPHTILYDLIAQHNEAIIDMKKSMDVIIESLNAQKAQHVDCGVKWESLEQCVPNGDFDGHRRYHEAIIVKMEARAKLWQDVSASVAKWGIIGALGWFGYAVWHEFILQVFRVVTKS